MPSVSVERRMQPAYVIGSVDVSWSPKVVTGDEGCGQGSHSLVGDVSPSRPGDDDGVAPRTLVGRGDDLAETAAPGSEHALDGLGSEIGPIGEDDDRGLGLRTERGQTAAERSAGTQLPIGTVDDAYFASVEVVRAGDDHDLVHGTPAKPLEDAGKQEALLGAAEARRRSGRKDDGGDQPTAASARSISARAI